MTAAGKARAAVFDQSRQLVMALHLLTPLPRPLPSSVWRVAGAQALAIPVARLPAGTESALIALAAQHGWAMRIAEVACAEELPLYAAIDPSWRCDDPASAARWHAGRLDASQEQHEWRRLDLAAPTCRFLLAAEDHAGAQRILDDLSALQTPGIRARPLLQRKDPGREQPYAYLWSVAAERYDPFLLRSASRVWWWLDGQSQRGWTGELYLQHPWSPDLPAQWLFDLPWPDDVPCVLIGPDAPRVLFPTRLSEGTVMSDYLQAVRLETAQPGLGLPLSLPAGPSVASFGVTFTRRKLGAAEQGVERIALLERQIQEKQQRLARLKRRAADTDELPGVLPDLLFLIPQPASGSVAAALQRLYIEWSDQPEDLGRLRHALLPASRLAEVGLRERCDYHVVTTASALGDAPDPMTQAWLADYAPQEVASRCLVLDPAWARHGLALFLPDIPQGQQVALYPDLRPSALAAQQLARAIVAGLAEEQLPVADRLHLLLPVTDGTGHRFLVLRKADFRPLSAVFDWHLAIELGVNATAVATELTTAVRARQFEDAIVQSAKGLQQVLARRVKQRVAQLERRLEEARRRMAELESAVIAREQAIVRQAARAAELDALQARVDQSTADTQEVVDDTAALLGSVQRRLWRSPSALSALRMLGSRQQALRASMRELLERLKALRVRHG